jgi:hypothetical protein
MPTITARYPSECDACGARIEVGDLVTHRDGYWVHAEPCTPEERAETVCARCFLTSCDCLRGD